MSPLWCSIVTGVLCVLCRCHVVEEFNRGVYDYIIATDEVVAQTDRGADGKGSTKLKGGTRKRKRDREYGVSRGIDFQGKF